MEQRQPAAELPEENSEGRQRELASKWFSETQVPLLLHKGTFPTWFQGCITRKGNDRCRHFVINLNKAGQLIVTGDTETHSNLSDLIKFYTTNPIEPFGEFLTTPCSEPSTSELYDVVQVDLKDRSAVSVKAMKDIASVQVLYAQLDHDRGQMRAQTPLTGSQSNGPSCPSWGQSKTQEAKPCPMQNMVYSELNLENCRSRSLPLLDDSTEIQHGHRLSAPSHTPPKLSPTSCKRATCHTYSLLDPRDHSSQSASQGQSSGSLEKLCDNPLYQTASGLRQAQDSGWGPHGRGWGPMDPSRPPAAATLQDHSTYAQVPHKPQQGRVLTNNTYELIPDQGFQSLPHMPTAHSNTYEPIPNQGFWSVPHMHTADSNTYELIPDQGHKESSITHTDHSNTYEQIPDHGLRDGPQSNTYETLENLQPKHSESSWGIKEQQIYSAQFVESTVSPVSAEAAHA
ncbi:SH2 domain-containing protein 7-like [Megalops cyprinoides]|uniref:SH2 domain-containing protein 7-like n=1 Tax=Megalops cyprinoides TaxID=118141 RepID=UPI001864F8B7|nr:SH2 domain-containing protein 7-like [Megalops cyprinoides]